MSIYLCSLEKLSSDGEMVIFRMIRKGSPSSVKSTLGPKIPQTVLTQAPVSSLVHYEKQYRRQKQNFSSDFREGDDLHVPVEDALDLIKKLAPSSKLSFRGKPLVCDLFGQVDLLYQIDDSGEELYLHPYFRTRKEDLSLDICDLIVAADVSWFVKGISLRLLNKELHPKWLRKVQDGEQILEGEERLQFLRLIEDLEAPWGPILEIEKAKIEEKKAEPLPVLCLKDHYGAFADLWMDYGSERFVPFFSNREAGKLEEWRNKELELQWEQDLLESSFIRKDTENAQYFCPMDQVSNSLSFFLEMGWKIKDQKDRELLSGALLNIDCKSDGDRILVEGKVKWGETELEVKDLVDAVKKGDTFLSLGPQKVALLHAKDFEHLGSLAKDLELVSEQLVLNRSRWGALEHVSDYADHFTVDADISAMRRALGDFAGIKHAEIGADFKGALRPYQQEGLNWLSFLAAYRFHGILADDMGLGKTIQVLALLSTLDLEKPALIVVPSSLLFNWSSECKTFVPRLNTLIYHGKGRKEALDQEAPHVCFTSYGTLRQDREHLSQKEFSAIILDEAQVIKNPDSQVAQAACSLRGDLRICLSGTPVENSLEDLWSQFRFLMPDLLGDRTSFRADLQAALSDQRFYQNIKKKIHPFILRRKKEDVARDLPEKIEQNLFLTMESEQREVYDRFLSSLKQGLLKKVSLDGLKKHRMEIFEAILRLRQIACHTALFDQEEGSFSSIKVKALVQDLETIVQEGKKVLVYSQFTSFLAIIKKECSEREWNYAYLDGSVKNREEPVRSFQEDPEVPIFLMSLKAGALGLNLTAADYVFLLDPWWNEAVEAQAIDRAHRIGRSSSVIAKRYLVRDSIEERMMELKKSKQAMVEGILSEGVSGQNLSIDDLGFLLS